MASGREPAVEVIRGADQREMGEGLRKVAEVSVQTLGAFMLAHKMAWLLPIIVLLVLFGGLIVLTQETAVALFIYTLF